MDRRQGIPACILGAAVVFWQRLALRAGESGASGRDRANVVRLLAHGALSGCCWLGGMGMPWFQMIAGLRAEVTHDNFGAYGQCLTSGSTTHKAPRTREPCVHCGLGEPQITSRSWLRIADTHEHCVSAGVAPSQVRYRASRYPPADPEDPMYQPRRHRQETAADSRAAEQGCADPWGRMALHRGGSIPYVSTYGRISARA